MDILQNKLRPSKLKDVIGQTHLIGKDKPLTNLVKNKKMFNMILYGRPGIGKTTIALAITNELDFHYRVLNASINTKHDFEVAIEEAKMYGELILIVDEIHRMNKDKQDILLSYIESGLIILIGLTSLNPYHTVNEAIRSRCILLELKPLNKDDIKKGIKKISKILPDFKISNKALEMLGTISNGDLRYAYNLIEFAYYSGNKNITEETINKIEPKSNILNDKNADSYYDLLSALQKSIRGSDVDASIYYLGRLLINGDLDIIIRRLSVIAFEDIGLANPTIGPKLEAAVNASLRVGMPEARIPLAYIVTEMALSPKSNSSYMAINNALEDINKGASYQTPANIKTHSKSYLYPHNYKNDYINQQYLPDEIKNKKYYHPKHNKYEKSLYEFNKSLKKE